MQQQGLFNGTNEQHGWNDDKLNSWGEPQQMQQQHNSWGKPKTPTNQGGQGWGDDGLVDTSSWGAPPKNPVISFILRISVLFCPPDQLKVLELN